MRHPDVPDGIMAGPPPGPAADCPRHFATSTAESLVNRELGPSRFSQRLAQQPRWARGAARRASGAAGSAVRASARTEGTRRFLARYQATRSARLWQQQDRAHISALMQPHPRPAQGYDPAAGEIDGAGSGTPAEAST